ncbi:DNA replication regulator sld2 like [Quillaja saponaria]|uniref:DNA replication regulator sld2 like n=1 Tax=Quillaja saponaria TaxID=32244 RepID=A0AAD7PM72_QUISA|nr:DNA replication regulator sld2 like [Quillaja saponaria]
MVKTLEAIKGGGGSIKVGTTGTISSLMTKEMEHITSDSHTPMSSGSKHVPLPVSVACGASTQKRVQQRKPSDEASSSSSNSINHKKTGTPQKMKNYKTYTQRIPMLGSDNVAADRTPRREKTDKKVSNIVEIVDIKCGNPDKAWASPITNRLKKLGFSKLSETIA